MTSRTGPGRLLLKPFQAERLGISLVDGWKWTLLSPPASSPTFLLIATFAFSTSQATMKFLAPIAALLITATFATAQDPTPAAGSTAGINQVPTATIEPPATPPPGLPAPTQDPSASDAVTVTYPPFPAQPVDASPTFSPIGSGSGDGSMSTDAVVAPRRRKSHVTPSPSPSPEITKDTSTAASVTAGMAVGSLLSLVVTLWTLA